MGVLIILIIVGAVIGIICYSEHRRENRYVASIASRDEEMMTQLKRKYSNIPENELRWIYSELDWVCNSLRDKMRLTDDKLYELVSAGTYNPLYPENEARAKLNRINLRYGWQGSDAIKFSPETSVSSVYENCYYLGKLLSVRGMLWSFHFYKE